MLLPLDQPPRDDNGEVVPHDHHQINNGDGIIRRISHHHLVEDEKAPGKRVSSAAFSPSSGANGGMSVDLQASIEAAGLNASHYVISPPFLGAVRFEAGELRGEGMMVGYDPLPENPHHGEVWGNFSKQKKKRLQALAQMFVQPKEDP